MLSVRSASIHRRISAAPGPAALSRNLIRLKPERYPVSAALLDLVCLIDFHAYGRMNDLVSIRLRREDRILHETDPMPYRGPYSAASHDFRVPSKLVGIIFPQPGDYNLDIMINGSAAYTVELSLL